MTLDAAARPSITWVVGSGGLLGGALTRCLLAQGDGVFDGGAIPWDEPAAAVAAFRDGAARLLTDAARADARWRIAWCAGAGVTGTSQESLRDEVAALGALLDAVADVLDDGACDPVSGAVFVASSVGGIYAGSSAPPFTEAHVPAPTSDYGRAKLAGEQVAARFAQRSGVPTVIGRITNLYGPGQNLAKPQGLISHLCLAQLRRQPISVYVSLDTIRDYLFVDDCADMIRLALDGLEVATRNGNRLLTKIFGAHQGATIGQLLGEFRRVFKRVPRVVLGSSSTAKAQAGDLRVRSTVWTELDRRAMTSLPAGVAATAEDLRRTVQHAG